MFNFPLFSAYTHRHRERQDVGDGMDISSSIPTVVKSVAFSFLTPQEVRRVSVKQLINPQLLDHLNRPTVGGLYDPALGPAHKQDMSVQPSLPAFKGTD